MTSDDRMPPGGAAPMVALRRPEDVIRAVPALLGRPPDDSVVVLGLRGPTGRVRIALSAPADEPPDEFARATAEALAAEGCGSALAVGYGPAAQITPRMDALRRAVPLHGIELRDALRVTDGRYWSYLCPSPDCCPAEGVPVPRGGPPVVPPAALRGGPTDAGGAVGEVAPVDGPERDRMDRATAAAEARCARMWSSRDGGGHSAFGTAFRAEGLREVRAAVAGALAGRAPGGADRVAWLALLLVSVRVRDEAWVYIRAENAALHADLWRRVFRMADPAYAAAPGSLLAFAAWLGGDAPLAEAALDRVARLAPRYSMAALIRQAVDHRLSPDRWRPVTPEWLERNSPEGRSGGHPAGRPVGPPAGGPGEGVPEHPRERPADRAEPPDAEGPTP
ncbi:DUF4192 domain-containing protein [Nocardiopsis sp. RSe5-2]|uniref:DUF4192 domain-containing protein n=1 Tax=Nocardiopsis endophytica TaxID=3018445 RepID=A0ABT4U7W0_9ACTN|nr:DUF4192 domain-containing protein [Nocardiopsis endophytica]MDA2813047.1 DUF4192 domain-containing protein [Nocardiopsis endophytica]